MSLLPKGADPTARRWFVYRLFATDGRLLYVGVTQALTTRLRQHYYGQPWAHEIATARAAGPYPFALAHEMERAAIRTELPHHNGSSEARRRRDLRRAVA